jgi:hypothetical protein
VDTPLVEGSIYPQVGIVCAASGLVCAARRRTKMILEEFDKDHEAQVSGIHEAARNARQAHATGSVATRNYHLRVLLAWIDYPKDMVRGGFWADAAVDRMGEL